MSASSGSARDETRGPRGGSAGLHVVFQVGETSYVLSAADVLHMESYAGATRVPGAPPFVAGLVQSRGRIVPVIDLRRRFGLPPIEAGLDSRVVVVQRGDRVVGLLADRAREIIDIPDDRFRPPPEVVARQAEGFVKSVAQAGNRLVMLIDFEKVIGEEELHGEER